MSAAGGQPMPLEIPFIHAHWYWLLLLLVGAIVMLQTGIVDILPFLLGALAAALVAYATTQPQAVQIGVFLSVSVVAYLASRPFSQRIARGLPGQFGVDRLVGRKGVVIENIAWASKKGTVRVGTEEWPAQAEEEADLDAGTAIVVRRIEGNRLLVAPVTSDDSGT